MQKKKRIIANLINDIEDTIPINEKPKKEMIF